MLGLAHTGTVMYPNVPGKMEHCSRRLPPKAVRTTPVDAYPFEDAVERHAEA